MSTHQGTTITELLAIIDNNAALRRYGQPNVDRSLIGVPCKCGALYEHHAIVGDFCPSNQETGPLYLMTTFEADGRMSRELALHDAFGRFCINELPTNSTGTDAIVCGRRIPPNSDGVLCPRCAERGAEL